SQLLSCVSSITLLPRDRLYRWLLRLKQPDGSFIMHDAGERDVRYDIVDGLSTAQHRVAADAARRQQPGGLSSLFWLPDADDELVVGLPANVL
ncbi:MAG: hypothetical protein BJ554DRAFT_1966, partial [Olpidium bornovanus]